jgi:hypothetical protein
MFAGKYEIRSALERSIDSMRSEFPTLHCKIATGLYSKTSSSLFSDRAGPFLLHFQITE